jgi:hypothetical protein
VPFRVVSFRFIVFVMKGIRMASRSFLVTLIGENELLMDRDNIDFSAKIAKWQKDPSNKNAQAPGDDRAPAWGWLGKLHYAGFETHEWVGIPNGMMATCLRDAATQIAHPTVRGKKSLKEASQAGILLRRSAFPLLVKRPGLGDWSPISYTDVYRKLQSEDDFLVHQDVVPSFGFRLDVRRARPQFNRAHVRVRPMFGPWRCIVDMEVTIDILDNAVMQTIWDYAGRYKGLGNWRPSLSRAGTYGTFHVVEGIPDDMKEVARHIGYTV